MPDQDRIKWDTKYARGDAAVSEPSPLLVNLDDVLPRRGKALDVAGGAGRNAIWLARRGLDVTVADISEAGLKLARSRAEAANVSLATMVVDLESDPLPAGLWDLVVCFLFFSRALFQVYPSVLRPGGMLVVVQPTQSNLLRHEKPPSRFLLDDGELPSLVKNLDIVKYEEGWLAEDRHDALLVARRATSHEKAVHPLLRT